jgi:hypothetical protein
MTILLALVLHAIGFLVLPPIGAYMFDAWTRFVASGGVMGWVMRAATKKAGMK